MRNPPTLVTLLSAALALGLAGLLPALVCLLTMILIVVVGLLVPTFLPDLVQASRGRSAVAATGLVVVVVATALTGARNLVTGEAGSVLAEAAAVLVIPEGVPLGLLAALAAGSLIAVTLELGTRRGVQSGLVLGTAVLGLACVAAPTGQRLLVPIVAGWPAALFALTRLNVHVPSAPQVRTVLTRAAGATADAALGPALRWRVVPVVLAILVSCGLLAAMAFSGMAELARNAAASVRGGQGATTQQSWDSKFLGGRMDLNTRGPLGQNPVAEVPAAAPAHWRTATLDYYDGQGWQVSGTTEPGEHTIDAVSGGVVLSVFGRDSARSDGLSSTAGSAGAGDPTQPDETVRDDNPGATSDPSDQPDQPDPSGSTAATGSVAAIPDAVADPGDLSQAADPGRFGIGDDTEPDPDPTSGSGGGSAGGSLETGGSTQDGTSTTTDQDGETRSDRVVIRGDSAAQLIAPGRVARAVLPDDYGQGIFVSAGDRIILPSRDGDEYTVTSHEYPNTDRSASLGAAADDPVDPFGADIDPRYLQVPQDLPERVRALGAEIAAAQSTRLAVVTAVEARLAAMMTYTLNAAVPPQGWDVVDYALFESGEGFCEHFASAEVMLLRSAGIPARMVVGYLSAGADRAASGDLLIRQAQAHAWVEVWFPDVGWVTSEATSGSGTGEGFWESVNSAFNRAMQDLADALVAFVVGVVGPVVLAVVLLVLWLFRRPLLRLLGRWRSRSARREVRAPPDPARFDDELRKAFARLESVLAARGEARGGSETLNSLRDRVIGTRRYGDPAQAAQLDQAFAVLDRCLYGDVPPGPDEVSAAAAVLLEEEQRRAASTGAEGQPVASSGQSRQLM